uniref:Uncharacterized protein n=1 Tax=Tetraselmis sp. GSL018 TaxID=582737 RepID=A0A061RCX5_9CHLO
MNLETPKSVCPVVLIEFYVI